MTLIQDEWSDRLKRMMDERIQGAHPIGRVIQAAHKATQGSRMGMIHSALDLGAQAWRKFATRRRRSRSLAGGKR